MSDDTPRKWPHRYESERGAGSVQSGRFYTDLPDHGDYTVSVLGPSGDRIPVSVLFEEDDFEAWAYADLTAEQARDLAESLQEAADAIE